MRQIGRRVIGYIGSVILAGAVMFTACPEELVQASDVYAEETFASGKWGGLSWKVTADGTLTISGVGEMKDGKAIDYEYPWLSKIYGVTSLIVSEGITKLADRAFSDMTTLKSVWLPDSLLEIGKGCFYGCGFESVNIPSNVKDIGEGPFACCSKLRVITVSPSNYYYMSDNGVLYTKNRFTLVQCPGAFSGEFNVDPNTGIIARFAFEKTGITKINLHENLGVIEYGAFSECTGLEEVVIPEGVYYIDNYAFDCCTNLRFVTLPTTLVKVGDYAFNGDGPILAVSFRGTDYQWNKIIIGSNNGRLYTANKTFFDPYDESNRLPDANLRWIVWGPNSYWYEDGIRQGTFYDPQGVKNTEGGDVRGREIYDPASNGWFWLDSVYSGAKAVSKEVWMPYVYNGEENFSEETMKELADKSLGMSEQVLNAMKNHASGENGGGKWVRYDANGKMIKGWYCVYGDDYLVYPQQSDNQYYYDEVTGMMAKGWTEIGGAYYHFDEVTGVLIK